MATNGYTYTRPVSANGVTAYVVQCNGAPVGTVTGRRGTWVATCATTGATGTGATRGAAMHAAIAAPAPKATVPASRPRKATATATVPTAPAAAPNAPQAAPVAPQAAQQAPTAPQAPQGRSGARTALWVAVWVLVAVCATLALVLRAPATMYGKAATLATSASVALRRYAHTL